MTCYKFEQIKIPLQYITDFFMQPYLVKLATYDASNPKKACQYAAQADRE